MLACSRVPDAPEDLNQLGSYIFTYLKSENLQYLVISIDNLYEWVLQQQTELEEGYRIENIIEQAVIDLGFADSIESGGPGGIQPREPSFTMPFRMCLRPCGRADQPNGP